MNLVSRLQARSARADQAGALFEIPIFEGLPLRDRKSVARIVRPLAFPSGSTIFHEGDLDERLLIVAEGRVRIHRSASEIAPSLLGPGDFFGETSLIAEFPRTASALSLDPVRLLALSRTDFVKLCASDPHIGVQIAINLSQVVAERLRQTNRLLKEGQSQGSTAKGSEALEESEILRHGTGDPP